MGNLNAWTHASVGAALLGLSLAVACGGSSESDGNGGGGKGGSSGSGTAGSGGGSAGTGTAGSGGGSAGTGTAGSGGGSAGTGTAGSGGGSAGTGAGGASGSGGSGGGCADPCEPGLECCDGKCINPANDINNCGGCGTTCDGPNPYCDNGTCGSPPCFGTVCSGTTNCCGSECCDIGQICCTVNVGPSVTSCTEPENGTCPVGCPMCVCAHPDTPVATPSGEVAIATLRVGDLVYSSVEGSLTIVPIAKINRAPVLDHQMVRVTLESGEQIELSPGHPTADGRTFADLEDGDVLDGVTLSKVELVGYTQTHTYDILPDSASGAYFAGGVLVGSTLR